MEDIEKLRDSVRVAFVSDIVNSPINANDFLYKKAIENKINNHSEKIIRFLYGKQEDYWDTFQGDEDICINYGRDNQINFSFVDYINFDFKNKIKYKTIRKNSAILIKGKHMRKHLIPRLNEMQRIINERPEEAFKLLKSLTALK